jgi:hypothetical protein
MELDFNGTADMSLSGTFTVDGPFQVWLLPALDGCFLVTDLESQYSHASMDCALPLGPIPSFPWWNETVSSAATLNLSSLTFDFGASQGVLPPVLWALIVVNTGTTPETLQVDTPILIGPA